MGLGKTVSTLTAIVDLLDRCEIGGTLVVAPLRVARLTWPDEIQKWRHTCRLRFSLISGSPVDQTRTVKKVVQNWKASPVAIAALAAQVDVYLANYDIMPQLTEWIENQLAAGLPLPFNKIVWDESSKMKSHQSRRFKLFKPLRTKFIRSVLLTGTPAPQNYADLWSQYYLLDGGQRLGKYISHFEQEHFETNPYNVYDVKLRDGHDRVIEDLVSDITLVLRENDHLKMPPLLHNNIEVELTPADMKRYKVLERDMFVELASGEGVEAFNSAVLTNKCRQFTSGAVYEQDALGGEVRKDGKRVWNSVHSLKLDALADIIEDAQGSPIMVAYDFNHERERLMARWPKAALLGSGVSATKEALIVRQWCDGMLPLLFAHPASVGHGLNLQTGPGHILVWLGLTYDLELYLQMQKRLHRSGQKRPVIVHHILAKGTIDYAVLATVQRKGVGMNGLLEALKAHGAGV